MIQHQPIRITAIRTDNPPCDLDMQHLGFCRASDDDAPDFPVNPFGEGGDVANDFRLPAFQPLLNLAALVTVRRHVDIFSRYPRIQEPLLHLFGVGAVYAVAQCRAVLAQLGPCRNDVGNQPAISHTVA